MANKSSRSSSSSSSSSRGIDLSKPSEPSGSAIDLGKKNEGSERNGLGVGVSAQVGTVGEFDVEAEISADISRLLPGGKLDVGITKTVDGAAEVDAGIGGRIVSPIGGFGAGVGGVISINAEGKIEIKSISGRIEAGGISIEVETDPKTGKTSASICYTFGVISSCVSIQPYNPKSNNKNPLLPPGENDDEGDGGEFQVACQWATIWRSQIKITRKDQDDIYAIADSVRIPVTYKKEMVDTPFGIQEFWVSYTGIWTKKIKGMSVKINKSPIAYTENTDYHIINSTIIQWVRIGKWDYPPFGDEYAYIGDLYYVSGNPAPSCRYEDPDSGDDPDRILYPELEPDLPPSKELPSPLPNPPQKKHMNDECCKLVKEIHKYLGIEKLKRNKFPVANAFLVAGGMEDTQCVDQYEIQQALFRMLANGLIINPTSQPLGVQWQNANATSWAAQVYEMAAESKSDGNSTQVFEMHAAFQLTQLMKVVAELTRKVEYLSEALGMTPDLTTELVPVMFTIHEAHKGFGKQDKPKEIDITKAKTDEQVEAVLAKMFKPSKIPITKWVFNPEHISISEALNKL